MPCGTFSITRVPENRVGAVKAEFELDSPNKVSAKQEADGTWTVTADFGRCADGSAPSQSKPFGA
jgi:hypothetical protein